MLGHVEAGFPYISDTATYAPESCIFSQFINMFAMLSECIKKKKYMKILYYSERIDWHFARSTVTSIYVLLEVSEFHRAKIAAFAFEEERRG